MSPMPQPLPNGVNPVMQGSVLQRHWGAPFWRQQVQDEVAQLPPGLPFNGPQMQLPLLVEQPIHSHWHELLVGYDGSAQQMTFDGSMPSEDGEHGAPFASVFTAQLHMP